MIIARFNLVVSSKEDADEFIQRVTIPVVPSVGDVVSILGNPVIVREIGWAIPENEPGTIYAYIRVSKASEYTFER